MGEKGALTPNLLSPSHKSIASLVGGTRNGLRMFMFEGSSSVWKQRPPQWNLKSVFTWVFLKGLTPRSIFSYVKDV